jgi:hypothetical protein
MTVAIVRNFLRPSRVIEKIFVLNLLVGLGFLVTLWLGEHGIPYLATLFGTIALFLPALHLAFTIEQLTEHREKLSTILLWTTIFTLTITPAATYIIGNVLSDPYFILVPLLPFAVWWGISLLGLTAVAAVKRVVPGLFDTHLGKKDLKEVAIFVAIFLIVMVANFLVYRFLPEADGYFVLITLQKAYSDPASLVGEPRILFLVLTTLFSKLTQLSPYWIFKVVFPLLFIAPIATVYLVARSLIRKPWLRILAGLSPLFFPIVLQEVLISRPQSIFVLVLVPALYLIGKISAEKSGMRQLYWLIPLMAAGIVGLKLHTLFFLLTIFGAIATAVVAWPYAKRRPLDALAIMVAVAFALYPWMPSTRIIGDLWHVTNQLVSVVLLGQFDLWFIDHYYNADGGEVGWPGWTALLYYGYNIGLFLPTVVILSGFWKLKFWRNLWHASYWPALGVFGFFFGVAEILPRFKFAFMPDRAWLFVALSVSLLIPRMLTAISDSKKIWLALLAGSALLSLLAGTSVTYLKQGWITPEEYEAVEFIKNETPKKAVFLGGGGIRIMVIYYGERDFVRPPESVFLSGDEDAVEKYLAEGPKADRDVKELTDDFNRRRIDIVDEIASTNQAYRDDASSDRASWTIERFRSIIARIEEIRKGVVTIDRLEEPLLGAHDPVYLIYSRNKFDSLYGTRDWWRGSNFYGANTDKFSRRYPAVYDKDGVTIWEVRR